MPIDITADNYQKLVSRTLVDRPSIELSNEDLMLVWNALGLAGEAGEVADLVKKEVFHQHPVDRDKLIKELGDCCWYIAAICTKLDIPFSQILAANIEKLERRYPTGFSVQASINPID